MTLPLGEYEHGEAAVYPNTAFHHALFVIKGRWPEGEKAIKQDPEYAYKYALFVIKGRWPEAEEMIGKDPEWAYRYAKDVVWGRWPEGEEAISKDPEWAYPYARDVVNGRWPEGEEAISKSPWHALHYVINLVKERWPKGEEAIKQIKKYWVEYLDATGMESEEDIFDDVTKIAEMINEDPDIFESADPNKMSPTEAYAYARDVIKGRWPEGEGTVKQDPSIIYYYAKDIIKGRWPEGEEAILKMLPRADDTEWSQKDSSTSSHHWYYLPYWTYMYLTEFIKNRWPEAEEILKKDKLIWFTYLENFDIETEEDIFL